MVIVPSVTLQLFHCLAKCRIESRVIPGRMRPFSGGVISSRSNYQNVEKKMICKSSFNTKPLNSEVNVVYLLVR